MVSVYSDNTKKNSVVLTSGIRKNTPMIGCFIQIILGNTYLLMKLLLPMEIYTLFSPINQAKDRKEHW
jgi:hypothetical protein